MTNASDEPFGGDEETTVPPPPDWEEDDRRADRLWASASGDFRTWETSVVVSRTSLYKAELCSEQGHEACFALDPELALRVATEVAREVADPYYRWQRLLSAPLPLATANPDEDIDTDVLFTTDDNPRVRVEREPGGDRIILAISSDDASLYITLQLGVAIALHDFFSGRSSERSVLHRPENVGR